MGSTVLFSVAIVLGAVQAEKAPDVYDQVAAWGAEGAVAPAAAAAPDVSWTARAGLILPLKDDADTDPLFGVGGKRRQAIDGRSFWQVGGDLFFGGGDERKNGIDVDFDLILFMAHGAYGQYLSEADAPNGFAWYAGGGIIYETFEGDATHPVFGNKVKFDDDNFGLLLKGGGDYGFTENIAVNAELLVLLGTDTLEVGLLAAFEFRF